jgi:predicted phage terminase large subunit-like protein
LKILSACDVALGGGDYLSMPIAYIYESGDVYIHDVVFDNSEKDITQPQVLKAITDNKVTSGFFESNQGGEGYKDDIDRQLKEKYNYKMTLVSKYAPTRVRKEQRIWDNAPTIRQFIFRDTGCRSPQYRKFMTNLYSFTINGKNKNDDAADSLSQLSDFINNGSVVKTARILENFM